MLLDGTEPEAKRPKVLGARSLILALALHLALFLFAYFFALVTRKPQEKVIPIDLTVVMQENLDGNEDEPPPLKPPTPEPEPPKPPTPKPKAPEPPPPLTEKLDAVEKVVEKPKPKKTAAELKKEKEEKRKKRLEEMRKKGKLVKGDKPKEAERQPNGKTGKKTLSDAEIQKLLNQGYKYGRNEQLAANEQQRCISIIERAFKEKWDPPPWTDTLRGMALSIQLDASGRVLGYKLIQSSGDANADETVRQAASRMRQIRGLSPEFLSRNKTVTIRVKVTPE